MRKEGSIASILEYPADPPSANLVPIPDVTISANCSFHWDYRGRKLHLFYSYSRPETP